MARTKSLSIEETPPGYGSVMKLHACILPVNGRAFMVRMDIPAIVHPLEQPKRTRVSIAVRKPSPVSLRGGHLKGVFTLMSV